MDRLLLGILEFLDMITLGTLSRWGAPDPDELREEARRRDSDQLERLGLAGSLGVAVTPLRPSGKVAVSGRTFEASSQGTYIDQGSGIEVIGSRGLTLIVRTRSDGVAVECHKS